MARTHRTAASSAALSLLAGAAHAQFVSDGNLNNLPVGNAPDCATPAGAWQFPANYSTGLVCEALAEQVTIVPTSGFQPGAIGNSLRIAVSDPAVNIHAVNLLTTVINEGFCERITVSFQIWVPAAAPAGGSVYVGGDMGGGGFDSALDRGPQLSWRSEGLLTCTFADPITGAPVTMPLVDIYPRNTWQNVILSISLMTDRFDVLWGPAGQTPQQIDTDLRFRSPPGLTRIDRFTVAHFGAISPTIESYIDNLEVALAAPACYPNCDNSTTLPFLNVADFTCFLQRFAAGDPYANCDGSTAQPTLNVADFTCFLQRFAAGCDC